MQDVPDDLDVSLPLAASNGPLHDPILVAAVESTGNGSAECTLYPIGAEGMDLMTQWITARDDAFVELRESQ